MTLPNSTIKRYDAIVKELFPNDFEFKRGYIMANMASVLRFDSYRIKNRPFIINGVSFKSSHQHEYDCGMIVSKGEKEYWVDWDFVHWLNGIYMDPERCDI